MATEAVAGLDRTSSALAADAQLSGSSATPGPKVDAIWQSLKAAASVPQRVTPPPSVSVAQDDPKSLSTPSSSGNTLQDLLLGRMKSKGLGTKQKKTRVFAAPLSWIDGSARQGSSSGAVHAEASPQGAERSAEEGERTSLHQGDAQAGGGGRPTEEARGGTGKDEQEGATDIASAAAAALAAARAATAHVVDTSNKMEVKEVRTFAGQMVEVTRVLDLDSKAARAAKRKADMQAESTKGLDALLAQIEKKKKLNILDKTRQDWGEYKQEAGVAEELEEYKRSGATYTEKVAFLGRADVREYEKERETRMAGRPLPGARAGRQGGL